MEKGIDLTLCDVGDIVFRVMLRYFYRSGSDLGAEMSMNSTPLQESCLVHLLDTTNLLIKMFPHRNYLQNAVFRIEVYKTKPGDMRGTRVAFVEIPKGHDILGEVKSFIEGALAQSGL